MTKPSFLFHATSSIVENNILLPFPVKCADGTTKPPAVYALSSEREAYAYVLKAPDTCFVGDINDLLMVEFSRMATYAEFKKTEAQQSWIHCLPSDTFRPNPEDPNEWISDVPVSFDPEQSILVAGVDDVMQKGVQVFCRAPGCVFQDTVEARREAEKAALAYAFDNVETRISFLILHMKKALLDQGKIVHLNQQAGISPVDIGQHLQGMISNLTFNGKKPDYKPTQNPVR